MEQIASVPEILEEALGIVQPHYDRMNAALMSSYRETIYVKDQQRERGVICTMTPKTKGCLMSDTLAYHLTKAFDDVADVEVRIINSVVGLLFSGKVYVKFNKMDENNSPSIQQRKWYKAITNQGQEIDGLPQRVIKMWAGIVPVDKQWSDVARCSLVYYEGGTVAWFTDLVGTTVQQLSIDMTPQQTMRRTTPKKKDGEQEANTGTNN